MRIEHDGDMRNTDQVISAVKRHAEHLLGEVKAGRLSLLPASATLDDALDFTSRRFGYASWAGLERAARSEDGSSALRAAALVEAALDQDLPTALALLDADPGLASYDLDTAIVTGNLDLVERACGEGRGEHEARIGSRRIPAIVACPRSVLVRSGRGDFAGCVRRLARAGANVNVAVEFVETWGTWKATPLYHAAGLHADIELTRALIDLGADPNDGETLYHAMEHHDPELLSALAKSKHGVDRAQWSYALIHLMDFEAPECLARYLEISKSLPGSFDPNHRHPQTGQTALHWAIRHGRSPEVVRMLLAAGFDPGAAAHDGRTCRDFAACAGDLATLSAMGDGPIARIPAYLLACTTGDRARADRLIASDPSLRAEALVAGTHALTEAAWAGRFEAVRGLIEVGGVPAAASTPTGATALHHAAYQGDVEMARYLLARGHAVGPVDRKFNATPLGWATWASTQRDRPAAPRGDHPGMVRLLLEAGAPPPSAPSGSDGVRAVLREFGVGA